MRRSSLEKPMASESQHCGEGTGAAILRAVAGDPIALCTLPPGLKQVDAPGGGDALADLALRAMAVLIDGLSEHEREKMGMVMGTTCGCLEMDREFDRSRRESGGRFASPAAF